MGFAVHETYFERTPFSAHRVLVTAVRVFVPELLTLLLLCAFVPSRGTERCSRVEFSNSNPEDKIELFDTNEYITTYGMDKVFVLYQNYAETYDQRIEDLITGHLDGIPSQLYSYEDFMPMARSFIKDNNVIGYLGR